MYDLEQFLGDYSDLFQSGFIILIVILGVVGIYRAWQTKRRTVAAYDRAATQLGLKFHRGGPKLTGRYRGLSIHISEITQNQKQGNDTEQKAYTRYVAVAEHLLPDGLIIEPRKALIEIGAKESYSKDPKFDKAFQVRTHDRKGTTKLLANAELRRAFLEVGEPYHQMRVAAANDGTFEISFVQPSEDGRRVKELVQGYQLLSRLADALKGVDIPDLARMSMSPTGIYGWEETRIKGRIFLILFWGVLLVALVGLSSLIFGVWGVLFGLLILAVCRRSPFFQTSEVFNDDFAAKLA